MRGPRHHHLLHHLLVLVLHLLLVLLPKHLLRCDCHHSYHHVLPHALHRTLPRRLSHRCGVSRRQHRWCIGRCNWRRQQAVAAVRLVLHRYVLLPRSKASQPHPPPRRMHHPVAEELRRPAIYHPPPLHLEGVGLRLARLGLP